MGETTSIEWCHHTFNAWIGCEKISPGCKHCYAAVDTFARSRRARGLELWGGDAHRHVTSAAYWDQPRKWNQAAEIAGRRHRVFCSSLSDVFEDRPDLLAPRARLAMVISQTPFLDWLLLTKRPENAERLWRTAFGLPLARSVGNPWLPNIWLGTTTEDQEHADRRIPHLLLVEAAVRFVSYEPALGPIDFTRIATSDNPNLPKVNALTGRWNVQHADDTKQEPRVHWIIVGGESDTPGGKARPFDLAWARSTIEQCRTAGTACFVKQLGSRPVLYRNGEEQDLSVLYGKGTKNGDPTKWARDLNVREFPRAA